jgi:hypothetical protein
MGLGPTLNDRFFTKSSVRTLVPNKVTFTGTGGYNVSIVLGET